MTQRLRGLEPPKQAMPPLAGEAEGELVARARRGGGA